MQALNRNEILAVLKRASKDSLRNHAMILLAFKHGLRASEVCGLRLSDVDLKNGNITVQRKKGSLKSVQNVLDIPGQPLLSEKKVLSAWLKDRAKLGDSSDYLFVSQKGGMMDRSAFYRVFSQIAEQAGLPAAKQHPHCLKHSLGFFLVEQGMSLPYIQQALGHKYLSSTACYLKVTDDLANKKIAKAFADAF